MQIYALTWNANNLKVWEAKKDNGLTTEVWLTCSGFPRSLLSSYLNQNCNIWILEDVFKLVWNVQSVVHAI